MTSQVATTVFQDLGDSGGIVYNSLYNTTAGIGTLKNGQNQMLFSTASNINNEFGISRY